MFLKNLKTVNFRNLSDGQLEFCPGLNILYGQNGQGKTNLLEAIFLLSGGKSFRGSETRELINYHQSESFLEGQVVSEITKNILALKLERGGKKYFKDDLPAAAIDFYGQLVCVSFAPADLNLIQGAPAERRRFLDRHSADLDKSALSAFFDYNRALKSKNILLKNAADNQKIESWNEVLINKGLSIAHSRQKLSQLLEQRANQLYARYAISDGELSLKIKGDFIINGEIVDADFARGLFNKNIEREKVMKKSLLGAQRDDLEILFSGRLASSFASQGQGKSIALALKLALVDLIEEKRGSSPVLLLDDLESELDQERNKKIKELLFLKERQTFISGTESLNPGEFYAKNLKVFKVLNGSIS